MRLFSTSGAVLLPFTAFASIAAGIQFNPDDEASIRAVTKQYSHGLMSLYKNNATDTAPQDIGIWPAPHYWWEGGAAWGGMIEYSMFSGDNSNVKTLQQALTSNYGPANNFILDYRRGQTGNDDQAFWALATMSALEYQFPNPEKAPANYLDVTVNTLNNIMGRWDDSSCGGGLKWQIYPENAYGYNYKNSISAGTAFSLATRLARYTGNQTYADMAVKIYDWTKKVGLISNDFEVYDGTDDKTNCVTVADKTQWSYNIAMFLHGSAFMFDYTKDDQTWKDRTAGFLKHAGKLFFKPYDNATDIMFEQACETGETGRHCNLDQQSFKAYMSRFMAKTAVMAPFTKDTITKYLKTSAIGAAKACSGGADGSICGSKWYTGAWDGTSGVGQQLAALEVTQALLMLKKGTLPAKNNVEKPQPSTSATPKPSSTPVPKPIPTPSSQAAPAPSSKAPYPVVSSAVLAPAPSSVAQAPASSAVVTSAQPPAATNNNPGGQFNEVKPSSSSCTKSGTSCTCTPSVTKTVYKTPCTPSVTTTVYVLPPSGTAPSAIPVVSTTLRPLFPPVNSTIPRPSQPLEFTGAASQPMATGSSVAGALIFALVAGFL